MGERQGKSVEQVVIAGCGVAALMVALGLARASDGRLRITIVGDPGRTGMPASAEAALPAFRHFLDLTAIEEKALVAGGAASFGYGTVLTGWSGSGASYIQPLGDIGAPIGPVLFHQIANRLRSAGQDVRLANYSLAALCAQAGRFSPRDPDPRSVLSTIDHGLHIDLDRFAALLRDRAEAEGVTIIDAEVSCPELDENGFITAVRTADGSRFAGNLFLDCTGSSATLISKVSKDALEDWTALLPCDRLLSADIPSDSEPELYVHVEAHSAGWLRTIPVQEKRSLLFAYSSAAMSPEMAEREFASLLPEAKPVREAQLKSGVRRQSWIGNCIAIGAAAGELESFQPLNLHVVAQAISRLIALFPGALPAPSEAAEYSRLTASELERARDFLLLHYKTNGRDSPPFWAERREMSLPEPLAYKLDLYRSRGRIALYDDEVFEEPAWVALLDGHGVRPRRHDPLADGLAVPQLQAHLNRIREAMIAAARNLPTHRQALSNLRGAVGAER